MLSPDTNFNVYDSDIYGRVSKSFILFFQELMSHSKDTELKFDHSNRKTKIFIADEFPYDPESEDERKPALVVAVGPMQWLSPHFQSHIEKESQPELESKTYRDAVMSGVTLTCFARQLGQCTKLGSIIFKALNYLKKEIKKQYEIYSLEDINATRPTEVVSANSKMLGVEIKITCRIIIHDFWKVADVAQLLMDHKMDVEPGESTTGHKYVRDIILLLETDS